jgi:hypothetical protein
MVEGLQRKKMRNKIITFLVITLLLAPYMPIPMVAAADAGTGHASLDLAKYLFNTYANKEWKDFRGYMGTEHWEHAKLILYLLVLGIYTWNITSDILLNLQTYVLMNPSPMEPSVLNVMNYFIFNLQIAYVLAIAATALYIVFASTHPKKRARAKGMLGRLIIGMLLVSISPYIINLFFNFSSGLTATILDQTDSSIAATVYTDLLWKTYWPSVLILLTPMVGHSLEYNTHHGIGHGVLHNMEAQYSKELKTGIPSNQKDLIIEDLLAQGNPEAIIADTAEQMMKDQQALIKGKAKTMAQSTAWGKLENLMNYMKIAPKPEQTFAFLMAEIAMVFALYGFLALRFLMLMIWTILFPLSIFLSTFELTKGLGRNMIEQTIFWTILQIFYAVSIDTIAVGFMILPSGYNYFGLGLQFGGASFFFVSFFSIAAALLLMLTPILVLMLSQRLTQMDVNMG